MKHSSLKTNFYEIEELNSSFLKTKIKVFAFGKNRNNSSISKAVFNKARNSIYNIPIVAKFNAKKDKYGNDGDLEGHNEYLTKDKDGNPIIKQDTYPIGVVSSDANITFEEVNEGTEENPDVKIYVVADNIYLWRRYEATEKIYEWLQEGIEPKVSMEIGSVEGEFSQSGVFTIDSFEFRAIAALGSDVEPCFPMAQIETYSKQTFEDAFYEMVEELKFSLRGEEKSKVEDNKFAKKDEYGTGEKITIDESVDSVDKAPWGEVDKTKLRNDILQAKNYKSLVSKAYLIVEDGWEDAPSEKLKYPYRVIREGKLVISETGVKAAYQRLMQNDPNDKQAVSKINKYRKKLKIGEYGEGGDKKNMSMSKKDVAAKFNLTHGQLRDELDRVLNTHRMMSEDWYGGKYEVTRFWLHDYDENYVYARDRKDNVDVKIPYSKTGDNVEFDLDGLSRVKTIFDDWDHGKSESTKAFEDEEEDDNDDEDEKDEDEEKEKKSFEDKEVKDDDEEEEKEEDEDEEKDDEQEEKDDDDDESFMGKGAIQANVKSIASESSDILDRIKSKFESDLTAKNDELSEKNEIIFNLNKKVSELSKKLEQVDDEMKAFIDEKEKREKEEREEKEKALFERYKEHLSEEEVTSFREKLGTYSMDEVESFIKSFLYDRVVSKPSNFNRNPQITYMGLPPKQDGNKPKSNSIWDELD